MSHLRDLENNPDAPASKRHKVSKTIESCIVRRFDTRKRLAWSEFLATRCFLHVPEDLFDVFELASELYPDRPCEAFVATLGIRLCGPFDLLATADQEEVVVDKPLYLHGRFFIDPPEVATVMADSCSDVGRHWGYFRDAPDQVPEYVVCAENSRECKFDIVGGSLFDVLQRRLLERRSTLGGDVKTAHLLEKIETHCNESACVRGRAVAALRAKRAKTSVATSLHHLGIVVPLDVKTNTGYRELPTTGKDLADLLQQLKSTSSKNSPARHRLSDLVTRATIASDECDFGTGLLLGLDVFTAGSCLEKQALQLLRVAYLLLRRTDFYKVASGHCKYRNEADPSAPIDSITSSGPKTLNEESEATTIKLPPSPVTLHRAGGSIDAAWN